MCCFQWVYRVFLTPSYTYRRNIPQIYTLLDWFLTPGPVYLLMWLLLREIKPSDYITFNSCYISKHVFHVTSIIAHQHIWNRLDKTKCAVIFETCTFI